MFQLTKQEFINLRFQNGTSSWGGTRYMPHAFTEEGIYMLMTVLKGELAVKQSKLLIRTFKRMRDYIATNNFELTQFFIKTEENSKMLEKHSEAINKIQTEMIVKKDLSKIINWTIKPNLSKEFLILNGKSVEAE